MGIRRGLHRRRFLELQRPLRDKLCESRPATTLDSASNGPTPQTRPVSRSHRRRRPFPADHRLPRRIPPHASRASPMGRIPNRRHLGSGLPRPDRHHYRPAVYRPFETNLPPVNAGRRSTPGPSPDPPVSANPTNVAACILSSTIATAGRIPPRRSTQSPDTCSSGLRRRIPGWDNSNGVSLPTAPPIRIAGMPRGPKYPLATRLPSASCRPCPSRTRPPYRRTTSELPIASPPYTPHIDATAPDLY